MSEREHAADPVCAAFDPGCRRRRPGSSIARAPASAAGISLKWNRRRRRHHHRAAAAAAPTRRRLGQLQVEMRRAGFSATTRQGIKNTILPAAKCRRESTPQTQSARLSIRAVGAVDPVALRSPELQRRPNRNIAKMESAPPATSPSCGRKPLHRPGGGSAAQVEMRRAGFSATTRQGIKNTILPARNVGGEHAADPVCAAFDPGCRRCRPGSSIARAPSSARTGISPKWNRRRRRHHHRAASSRCPDQAAAGSSGREAPRQILGDHPPRDKEHHLASREMSEREHAADPVSAAFDPGCRRCRPQAGRSDRPSSIVGPNRNITKMKSAPPATSPSCGRSRCPAQAAARQLQVEMRRAGFFGDHPPRDKEHHLASRKCRRESTP